MSLAFVVRPLFQEMSKRGRTNRGQSLGSLRESYAESVQSWGLFVSDQANACYAQLLNQTIDHGAIMDWEFLEENNPFDEFIESFQTDEFTGPRWERLFRIYEPVYDELVREFFAT